MPAENAEFLKMAVGTPQSCIWVGDIAATTRIPLLRVTSKFSVRPTDISVMVDTDLAKQTDADHWAFYVEKAETNSTTYSRVMTPFRVSGEGLRAGIWKVLQASAKMTQGQTLALRIEAVGTPGANLSGVSVSFSMEIR